MIAASLADQPRRNISSGRDGSNAVARDGVGLAAEQIDEDAAGARGVRRARRQPRRAGHAGRAADDGDVAEAALVRGLAARPAARTTGRALPTSQASASLGAVVDAEPRAPDAAGVIAAAAGEEAGLRRDQRQRVVGDDARRAERLAAVDVEARGHVDREHARAARGELGDAGDRGGDVALRRARGADAEQRVDDEIGVGVARAASLPASNGRGSRRPRRGARERLRRVGWQRAAWRRRAAPTRLAHRGERASPPRCRRRRCCPARRRRRCARRAAPARARGGRPPRRRAP